jgi:anti-sigma-K factor RskA
MNGEHVEMEELIAAYAVHALEVDERARVQSEILDHIAGCDPCRALFRELGEVSGELALAAPPARVSQDLEARVMDAARGVGPAALQERTRRGIGIAAAVAAAAVIALAVWNVQLGSSLRNEQSKSRVTLQAMALLSDPSARHATLAGTTGTVSLALRSDGSAALAASGMPATPAGHVYELWFLRDGTPTAATVFTPEDGTAVLTLRLAGRYDAAAITLEKGPNGSTAPTTPVLYTGTLSTQPRRI